MEMLKQQPEFNELVMFCGHLEFEPYHLFSKGMPDDDVPPEVQTITDDQGRVLHIRYVILCDKCNDTNCDNPFGVNLKPMLWNLQRSEAAFVKNWKN